MTNTSGNNDPLKIMVAPLASVIKQITEGVAEAQMKLDEASIKYSEETYSNEFKQKHPELVKLKYKPTSYVIPEVNVELKTLMHYRKETGKDEHGLFVSLISGKEKSITGIDYKGTSTIKFKIVPIPPSQYIKPKEPASQKNPEN